MNYFYDSHPYFSYTHSHSDSGVGFVVEKSTGIASIVLALFITNALLLMIFYVVSKVSVCVHAFVCGLVLPHACVLYSHYVKIICVENYCICTGYVHALFH